MRSVSDGVKITDIKQQAKRKDRYSIFVDEKYSFALSEAELLDKAIKVGQELTEADLDKLKDFALIDKGVYRVLDLVSRRPRSRWEVEDYLRRKKYDKQDIGSIVRAVDDKGYINDENFAKRWVDNRRLLKPISTKKLRLELKQKRINDEIISKVLDADNTDERQVLRELIAKKQNQTRYQDKQKLIAYLGRQGFNYGDIKEVLDELNPQS